MQPARYLFCYIIVMYLLYARKLETLDITAVSRFPVSKVFEEVKNLKHRAPRDSP